MDISVIPIVKNEECVSSVARQQIRRLKNRRLHNTMVQNTVQ